MRIYANKADDNTVYYYIYYGETEVDADEDDEDYEELCEECDEVHHQLDIAEELLIAADCPFGYDGWGKLVVTQEVFETVLKPAIDSGKLDNPINIYHKTENTSWDYGKR